MKRLINLRNEVPLLDIRAFGRASHAPTPAERVKIALTVRRAPEVMVRVTGGARTVAGVKRHMGYIVRDGELPLETDTGYRLEGPGVEGHLVEDWDLDLDQLTADRSIRGRKPAKLVHNVFFSMPPGTPAQKVLTAVRQLAQNEWQLKYRYAMALHTDQPHPHVHVVLKAMAEEGKRLNIQKSTLRSWRAQFAANMRELGVAANATERAVRGQIRVNKITGVYRAMERGDSTQLHTRRVQLMRETVAEAGDRDPGREVLLNTRNAIVEGWLATIARLRTSGYDQLATAAREFVGQMPRAQTEKAMLADTIRNERKERSIDSLNRAP
jgi:Relaxase/Mobilisation nuclease domain